MLSGRISPMISVANMLKTIPTLVTIVVSLIVGTIASSIEAQVKGKSAIAAEGTTIYTTSLEDVSAKES